MTTITIDSNEHRSAVLDLLNREQLHNSDWSGAEFSIELGDYVSVDTEDEIAGAALLKQIHAVIAAPAAEKIIIFWDTADQANPGFSWRTRCADGSEDTGMIEDEQAAAFLRDLENGEAPSVSDREALAAELKADGVDSWNAIYVDTNGQEIGALNI